MRSIILAAAAGAASASLRADRDFYGNVRSTAGCTGTTFDYYMLVTQYAITLCADGDYTCSADWQFFTLHGLWPENNDGSYPCTCTNEAFKPSSVAAFESTMDKYWPSLNGASSSFWSHEWSKHGTCATSFKSQTAFFNGTLALRTKYSIEDALATAGFAPSNTQGFTKSQFGAAMKAAYGATAILTCDTKGNIEGATQCISKAGAVMECPSNVKPKCDATTIYLPASMSAPGVRGEEEEAKVVLA